MNTPEAIARILDARAYQIPVVPWKDFEGIEFKTNEFYAVKYAFSKMWRVNMIPDNDRKGRRTLNMLSKNELEIVAISLDSLKLTSKV